MFDALMLYGGGGVRGPGALVWGYRPIAVLTSWRITKAPGAWTLSATITQAQAWQCKQAAKYQELLFTAPRDKGRWCWEVRDIEIGTTELRGTLGPPLQ